MYVILHILSGEYFRYYSYSMAGGGVESNLYTFISEQEAEKYLLYWERNDFMIAFFISDKSYKYFNIHELQIIKLSKEEIQNAKIKK